MRLVNGPKDRATNRMLEYAILGRRGDGRRTARRADACVGLGRGRPRPYGMGTAKLSLLAVAFFLCLKADSADRTRSSPDPGLSFESKIRILSGVEKESAPPVRDIVISDSEANTYLKDHGREFLPPGVHDPSLRITPERVFAAAMVNFEELSRANPNTRDWGPKVLAAMFKGAQRVTAAGKLQAQNGQGRVKIETFNIGSTAVPDWLVDFILENYLQPRYGLDLSKPFVLPDHVTRIELGLGHATFFRNPAPAAGHGTTGN